MLLRSTINATVASGCFQKQYDDFARGNLRKKRWLWSLNLCVRRQRREKGETLEELVPPQSRCHFVWQYTRGFKNQSISRANIVSHRRTQNLKSERVCNFSRSCSLAGEIRKKNLSLVFPYNIRIAKTKRLSVRLVLSADRNTDRRVILKYGLKRTYKIPCRMGSNGERMSLLRTYI